MTVTASHIKFGLLNCNSVKCFSDYVRNAELSSVLKHFDIVIISETKLQHSNKIINFFSNKIWFHNLTSNNDNAAGVSIAYNPLLGFAINLEIHLTFNSNIEIFKNRIIAVLFTPAAFPRFIVIGVYAPASGNVS